MAVNSRESLKEYCLRALGDPVLEINVDDQQLEDRIDEAMEYWRLYHYDGIEKMYLKHQIRASEMVLGSSIAGTFKSEEVVTGVTSGARARVATETSRISSGNLLLIKNVEGVFTPGEAVLGTVSGASTTTTSVTLREFDNRYIQINDWVYGITRVIPFTAASSSKNIFDLQYQLRLNDLYDLTSTSIVYYKTVMSHLAMLDLELNGMTLYRFNRLQNRLYLDINWETDVPLGDFIMVECYRALNPADFVKVYNEAWLKHYVTALFKRQWGINLKKFSGLQLPGGVTLDGNALYDEAMSEIKDLEDDLTSKSSPLEFFMG